MVYPSGRDYDCVLLNDPYIIHPVYIEFLLSSKIDVWVLGYHHREERFCLLAQIYQNGPGPGPGLTFRILEWAGPGPGCKVAGPGRARA